MCEIMCGPTNQSCLPFATVTENTGKEEIDLKMIGDLGWGLSGLCIKIL